MLKNEEIISDELELANTLNTFFSNTIKNLKISEKFADHYLPHTLSRHPTLNAILKYKYHPSIPVVTRVSQRFSSFYFSPVDKNAILKEISKLKPNKAVQDTYVSVKILKENADFSAEYIYFQYNQAIRSSNFPDCFKFANIAAAFKQGSRNQKNNYKPISMLPLISKV